MGKNILFHADDFGLSRGITRQILLASDQGCLNSLSIVPNGYAFDEAIESLRSRPHIRVSIHLNFVEGPALSKVENIKDLINHRSEFYLEFLPLWKKHIFANTEGKKNLKEQLTQEIRLQVKKVYEALGKPKELSVDSHQHMHMIPFVFECILEVAKEFPIKYIRLPHEPFFVNLSGQAWKNYFGSNLLKQFILNNLSRRYVKKLESRGIKYSSCFIGVLFTGKMTENVLKSAINRIADKISELQTVEVLFHPGRAIDGEEIYWAHRPKYTAYYFSKWRDRELNVLMNKDLLGMIKV